MRITIPYRYTEEVIPKRCRKPRRVTQQAVIALTIHEVTSEEAPVAIIQHGHDWDGEGNRRKVGTVYRWWKGRLFVHASFQRYSHAAHEDQTAQQFTADPYPYNFDQDRHDSAQYRTKAQRRKDFREWARSILFVDGQRWETGGEPRYVVMTFGLGCNHGLGWGTDLSTDTSYNSNISRDRYFRIDQFEQAVAETARIATARGDTKALPVIEKQNPDTFEILIPEAVRLNPHKEHGTGCAFINQMESVIEGVKNPTVAGFMGMALAFRPSQP
jgi:hypothetical protein